MTNQSASPLPPHAVERTSSVVRSLVCLQVTSALWNGDFSSVTYCALHFQRLFTCDGKFTFVLFAIILCFYYCCFISSLNKISVMNSKCIPMFVAPVFVQIDREHPDCTLKTSSRITDLYIKHFYTGSVRFYQECTLVAAEYNHGPHKTLGA